jgi:hypothetical protein
LLVDAITPPARILAQCVRYQIGIPQYIECPAADPKVPQ